MDILSGIQKKVRNNLYEYSKHAVDQSIMRNISVQEVKESLLSKIEMIEDYPEDYYGPCCLILGFTKKGKPIHLVCSYPSRSLVKLITLYEPDENEWINFRKRK
jgi:hypothetical protein